MNADRSDWEDEIGCVDDYPEHDYKLVSERDGVATHCCTRCDAEIWEDVPDE